MRLHVNILAVIHRCCVRGYDVTVIFAHFHKAKSKNNGTLLMVIINSIRIFSLQSLLPLKISTS